MKRPSSPLSTAFLATFPLILTALLATPHRAVAQDKTTGPDLRSGALRGKVVDIETGQPVAGALVALRDRREATVAWTRTDAEGNYTLAVAPLEALQLQGRHRGMAMRVFDAGAAIVEAPVKFVGGAMRGGPFDVVRVIIAGAIGGPVAIGGLALGKLENAAVGKMSDAVAVSMAENKGTIDVAGSPMRSLNGRTREAGTPGGVMLSVSAPCYRDLTSGWAGAYWIAPAASDGSVGAQATLEPVELAKPTSLLASRVHPTAIQLSDLTVGSTLVPAGDVVPVSVKLNAPDNTAFPIRLFARSSVGGTVVELKPVAGSPGFYQGNLPIPLKAGSEPGVVSVVALHAYPVDTTLPKGKGGDSDPLALAAARLDGLHADKPFSYDPCIFAAENRLDTSISVLGRKELSPAPTTVVALAH